MQHTLMVSDIARIDQLQLQYTALFDCVPEYARLKRPKHHQLAHLAPDIWRFGPLRGFWTMGFEGNNTLLSKQGQSAPIGRTSRALSCSIGHCALGMS